MIMLGACMFDERILEAEWIVPPAEPKREMPGSTSPS
jgi:hypothetical protein